MRSETRLEMRSECGRKCGRNRDRNRDECGNTQAQRGVLSQRREYWRRTGEVRTELVRTLDCGPRLIWRHKSSPIAYYILARLSNCVRVRGKCSGPYGAI